jgi:SAM-dependent methyltransferase
MIKLFTNTEQSHKHSLETLDALYLHTDFMESIHTLVDLGCGDGADLEWWATRTTNDEVNPKPLNINCTGVDLFENLPLAHRYSNISYQRSNFEKEIHPPKNLKFDVLWCHDSFQYCTNPITTLKSWHSIAADNSMLALIVPQTAKIQHSKLAFEQPSGCYYHHTLVSLIHMLAVSGWDCRSGFFLKRHSEDYIHAVVYRSNHSNLDPHTTTWYDLAELGLLPESAEKSINAHGYLRQEDLILEWLDHSLTWYGQQ